MKINSILKINKNIEKVIEKNTEIVDIQSTVPQLYSEINAWNKRKSKMKITLQKTNSKDTSYYQ